jgi:hypothetical protein
VASRVAKAMDMTVADKGHAGVPGPLVIGMWEPPHDFGDVYLGFSVRLLPARPTCIGVAYFAPGNCEGCVSHCERDPQFTGPGCPIFPVQKCLPECVSILCHLDSRA